MKENASSQFVRVRHGSGRAVEHCWILDMGWIARCMRLRLPAAPILHPVRTP